MNFNVFAMAVRPFGGWLSPKILLIMKLTTLFLIITLMQVSARGYSQKINLNEDNKPLKEVFKIIEKQTSYVFFYDNNDIKSTKIAISIKNASIDETLKECFKNLPLTYKIVEKNIVVTKKDEPVNSPINQKAPLKIQGKVTDTTGKPLPGVNIKVKGSNAGGISDVNGGFIITVSDDQAVLIFSFVGYITREIKVRDNTSWNVILKEDNKGLNEIVVVGYGSQKKVNLTGAVSTISGAVLEDRPIPNVGRGLVGQLPGLTITTPSGQPGASPTFNIWGFTSINGGSPLILVDNVQTDANSINPDDIASISVLKDAASSAVYGSSAAYGVVLITTKTGKAGKPTVNFSSNYSLHKITELPDVVTDPATVIDYKNRAYFAYYGTNYTDWNSGTVAYANARSKTPSLPTTIVDPQDPTRYDYAGATNWFKEIYKPVNTSQNNNLSISGGGDRITYFVSGGFNDQNGVYRYGDDYYKRFNMRAKLDIKVTDWLHINTNTTYNRTINNQPSLWTSDFNGDASIFHTVGRESSLTVPYNPDGSYTFAGTIVGFLKDGGRDNDVTNETQNTVGLASSFFKNSLRIYGDYTFRAHSDYDQAYNVAIPYETGPNQPIAYAGHSNASASSSDLSYQAINLYAEYEKTIGKHYFKGMIGFNQQALNYNTFGASRDNLITNSIGYLNGATAPIPSVSGSGYQWSKRGEFSRLNYVYDNKYLFELDGRYDGSSRFPVSDHYTFLPSGSLGWRVSEEPFFNGLKNVVDNLKFRASYGTLGNDQNLGNYQFIPLLPSSTTTNLLGGLLPVTVGAPNLVSSSLTWEKVYNTTVGVDATLFHNLDISLNVYQRNTKNMISTGFQLPAVLGAGQPLENSADERTRGWDLNVTYHNKFDLAGKPFNYTLRASIWDDQSVITRFNNPSKNWKTGSGYYVGMHPGEIWGLTDLGIFQTDAAAKAAPNQSAVAGDYANLNQAGELQYEDRNHDGKITLGDGTVANPGDAHVIGNISPRYQFSGGANFSWNNIDFGFFFQGVGKQTFYPTGGYYWSMFYAPWENLTPNILNNTWTPQNPNAFYPSLKGWREGDSGPYTELAIPQTRYLYSAAYIRLKNLTVGYSFPVGALKKIGIDRIRVYFSGDDLWESSKLPQGFDPEQLNSPEGYGAGKVYPFTRQYSFGLSVKF